MVKQRLARVRASPPARRKLKRLGRDAVPEDALRGFRELPVRDSSGMLSAVNDCAL